MAISQKYPDGNEMGEPRQHAVTLSLFGLPGAPNPNAVTANTTDATTPAQRVAGVNGAVTAEINNAGAGTCTVSVQGTLDDYSAANDSSRWTAVQFKVNGTANPPSVVTQNLGATSFISISILDAYPTIRIVITNQAGVISVSARIYLCPV